MDLHRAAADCDLAAIQRLLAADADVNAIGALAGWDDDQVNVQDHVDQQDHVDDDAVDSCDEAGLFEEASDLLVRGEQSTPLLMAIDSEADDQRVAAVVELLLSAGAKVNLPDECGRTPLMGAAAAPRLAVVRQLLAAGATVHAKSETGATALHWTLNEDNDRQRLVSVARDLTAQGADPGKRDKQGRTPLMLAARLGLVDLVRDWIGSGLDPEATDKGGRNTLSYAFQSLAAMSRNQEPPCDPSEVAEGLARLGIDPDSELARQALKSFAQPPTDATPLELMMSGAESGQEFETARRAAVGALHETVEMLLEQGCSLESSSPYLAKAGRTDLLKRVSHLTLDAVNPETGETALTEAVAEGQVERVRKLLDAGADPNVPNFMAMTPLMCAPTSRRGRECGRLLAAAGADLNLANEHGLTALDEALLSCDTDKIPFLLRLGADPRQGIPLLWALARELPTELSLLLELGADSNARLRVDHAHHFPEYLQGTTAFMRACADQPVKVLQKMLDAGADLTATDRQGQTCVGVARRFGRDETARWLLARGAPSPGQ